MMKFVHVTDPHLVAPGETVHTIDPLPRFSRCVDAINRDEADARMVIITGDLADRGQTSAYQALKRELGRLELPYHLLIGNHDDRQRYLAVFDQAWVDPDGFVQGVVRMQDGVFAFLDTVDQGQSSGTYCDRRKQWLSRTLAETDAACPVYLFMHHPPFDVHIPFVDRIGLQDQEAFHEIVAGHSIRHLFFGHVHRHISGSWRGIPFSTLPSTAHQVAFNMRSIEAVNYSDEPPAYNLVVLEPQTTIVHSVPFMHAVRLPC